MNIILSKELESFIEAKVNSGEYLTANDVVQDALHNLLCKDSVNPYQEFIDDINKGLHQAKQGELHDGEEFFNSLAF